MREQQMSVIWGRVRGRTDSFALVIRDSTRSIFTVPPVLALNGPFFDIPGGQGAARSPAARIGWEGRKRRHRAGRLAAAGPKRSGRLSVQSVSDPARPIRCYRQPVSSVCVAEGRAPVAGCPRMSAASVQPGAGILQRAQERPRGRLRSDTPWPTASGGGCRR